MRVTEQGLFCIKYKIKMRKLTLISTFFFSIIIVEGQTLYNNKASQKNIIQRKIDIDKYTKIRTSQPEDSEKLISTFISYFEGRNSSITLNKQSLGWGLLFTSIETQNDTIYYFADKYDIDVRNDSMSFISKNRTLFKSQNKAIVDACIKSDNKNANIENIENKRKADNVSNWEMLFKGKIIEDKILLSCEGKGCKIKDFIFKKVPSNVFEKALNGNP